MPPYNTESVVQLSPFLQVNRQEALRARVVGLLEGQGWG